MQNRYAGDVGDFGKLGLLRILAQSGLKVGINWYLTEDEDHNNDGKHISYLNLKNTIYDACDPELRGKLGYMVFGNQRSVQNIEEMRLIPECIYFNCAVPTNFKDRAAWHKQGLLQLSNQDIVFLDPDNGLIVKSVLQSNPKSVKYVLHSEIEDYYNAGHSVIFYNHRNREPEEKYLARFLDLKASIQLEGAILSGLRFFRGSTRDYIFISRPERFAKIRIGIENLLQTSWKRHFKQLVL